jgi:hypothetical protein
VADIEAFVRITAAAFVEARVGEDEKTALAAWPGPWATSAEEYEVIDPGDEPPHDVFAGTVIADVVCLSSNQQRATARHIARQDPAQTLADVASTRLVLAMWRDPDQVENCWALDENGQRYEYADGRDQDEVERQVAVAWAIDSVVRMIALRWETHSDFDPTWRPA